MLKSDQGKPKDTSVGQVGWLWMMANSRSIIQLDASTNQRRRHMQQTEGQNTDKHRVEHADMGGEREQQLKRWTDWWTDR